VPAGRVAPVKGIAVAGAVALLVLAGARCGSGSSHSSGSSNATNSTAPSGQGVGAGLRAAGMQRCAGPVSARGDTSTPVGAVGPVSLTVYAERGLAGIVASGSSAQQHAIDLALLRNHVATSVSATAVAATERAWRRRAMSAVTHSRLPPGPCRSGVARLPVLAATEVVCPDQVLIPLGHRPAMQSFINVLSKLVAVKFTPAQVSYLGGGEYLTTPESTDVTRPYCHGS
jgi:hypothetical protein